MTEAQPTLNSLAAKISELSESLTGFLRDNDVPQPTFAADSPTSYTKLTAEAFSLKQQLADSLNDLWYLSQGPSESIFNYVHTVTTSLLFSLATRWHWTNSLQVMPDAATLNILNYFNFWAAVPLDGSASYQEIAKHVSLPQEVVQRVLEHATTLRLFAYTTPGKPSASRIEHSSRSAALAKSSGLRALVSTIMDDAGPPMMVMNAALDKYARGKDELTVDVTKTSFAHFHSGDAAGKYVNSWELLENDGEGERKGWRQRNFVEFMRYIKDIFQLESVVLGAIDWKAAGKATVVDVSQFSALQTQIAANSISSAAPAATTTSSSRRSTPTSPSRYKTCPKSRPSSTPTCPTRSRRASSSNPTTSSRRSPSPPTST